MLAKEPDQRPSSLEVRQIARAAAHAPSELRDNIEVDIEVVIDDLDLEHTAALADGSSEIDAAADAADDVTLLHQNMRKPRWTPPMPNDVAVRRRSASITPRAVNDQVAGEIGLRRG